MIVKIIALNALGQNLCFDSDMPTQSNWKAHRSGLLRIYGWYGDTAPPHPTLHAGGMSMRKRPDQAPPALWLPQLVPDCQNVALELLAARCKSEKPQGCSIMLGTMRLPLLPTASYNYFF